MEKRPRMTTKARTKTTAEIAREVGKSERQVQRILNRLVDRGFVIRHGNRGGWSVSTSPPVVLTPPGRPGDANGDTKR